MWAPHCGGRVGENGREEDTVRMGSFDERDAEGKSQESSRMAGSG